MSAHQRVSALEVVDEAGRVRAKLRVLEGQPTLVIYAPDGSMALTFLLNHLALPAVTLCSSNYPRAGLAVGPENECWLRFFKRRRSGEMHLTPAAGLGAADGSALLEVRGVPGAAVMAAVHQDGAPTMVVSNVGGDVIWEIP